MCARWVSAFSLEKNRCQNASLNIHSLNSEKKSALMTAKVPRFRKNKGCVSVKHS